MDKIEITGASEHNLKRIDLTIPRGKFVVVTGLSGSGKSSLAFDTIYAEGQRRYMETLSPYARHFIGILERPAVESINGLSPIIAIEQKTTGNNPRSTVGTITEVYDFLRLLYARAAYAYSPVTGKPMIKYTGEQITRLIIKEYKGTKCLLLAPLVVGRKGHYKELFDNLLRKGYQQVRVDGEIVQVADAAPLDRYKTHFIELVVDKLIPSEEDYKRIHDSVGNALERGKGTVAILKRERGFHLSGPAEEPFLLVSDEIVEYLLEELGIILRIKSEPRKRQQGLPEESVVQPGKTGVDPLLVVVIYDKAVGATAELVAVTANLSCCRHSRVETSLES